MPNDDGELSQMTKENLSKFANNLNGDLRVSTAWPLFIRNGANGQAAIEKDFMKDMPKLREYIKRLQYWRDMYEKSLDSRPRSQPLDQGGCNLIEFHHTKFDDIEVPGQYAQVRLDRFAKGRVLIFSTLTPEKSSSRSFDSRPRRN